MTGAKRRRVLRFAKAVDVGLCAMAMLLAVRLFWYADLRSLWLAALNDPKAWFSIAVLMLVWHLCLSGVGAYQSHRLTGTVRELAVILNAALLCSVATLLEVSLVRSTAATERSAATVSAVSLLLTIVLLGVSRLAGRAFFRRLRKRGRNLRNVLIVGTNKRAVALARSLENEAGWGYRLSGFVDDHWHMAFVADQYKGRLLGRLDDLPALLRTTPLDEVILVLPIASFYRQARELIQHCATHGLLVRYEASLFDFGHDGSPDALPHLVTLHDRPWNQWALGFKRLLDIVISSGMLLFLAPVLALIASLVAISSPGPVFFVQERVGLGKRSFRMFKFRTMVVDAEKRLGEVVHLNESNGPTFKLKHDPRITPFGNFLRSTSLDELPQLFNVLRGDMSLVGPRPLPMRDYAGFEQDSHRRRFSVKPGLTCLWQVAGRSSIGFKQWMELDLDYIDQWSLWLDLRILAQTVPAVLRRSGAV